jgi:hypothetical protein
MTKTIFGEHTSSDADLDPSLSRGRKITALYLGWQHPQSDLWLPVAKMTWAPDLSEYCFRYTQGMQKAIEISPIEKSAFIHQPQHLYQSHITQEESLKFKSRMPLSRTRDVPKQQEWLGLPPEPIDPISYVSRSGGYRHHDSYDVFPEVNIGDDGCYHFFFLPLDPWKTEPDIYQHLLEYESGCPLQIDGNAVKNGSIIFGKLPGYLAAIAKSRPDAISLDVAQINPRSPHYYSLLCHATVNGSMYTPFTSSEYKLL